jgi:ABC-type bacteriocin/lantibiotic exporter with double-glycine peptidase domain
MNAVEDGAACLAMMSTYFGKPRTVAQCRAVCASRSEGLTTEDLIEGARMLGFSAKDWIIDGADSFDALLSLPAIVNWHDRYFVIVERVTPTHVILIDPAVGRRRLARELFNRFCSGAAVTFTRADNDRRYGRLLRDALKVPESRSMAILLIVSTLALQICSLALPVGLLLIVDHILPLGIEPSPWWVVTSASLVVMAHVILRFVQSEALVHLRMEVEARWKHRVFSRGVGGMDGASGYLVSQPIVACLHMWFVICSLFLVAWWSPALAGVAAGFCLMQVCVAAWASGRLAARQSLCSLVDGLMSGMGLCSLLGLLFLGAHEVLAGRLTMAGMLAMNVLAASALIPVGGMTKGLQRFSIARARFERLCDALDAADEGADGIVSVRGGDENDGYRRGVEELRVSGGAVGAGVASCAAGALGCVHRRTGL